MKKTILIFTTITLIATACYLIPSFAYNKLEYEFRMNYSMAMQLEQFADELIAVRQLGPTESITDEEFQQIASSIEKALEESIEYTNQATTIQNNQTKIPLLPSKYGEYHQQKRNLITDHNQLTQEFLQIKINEHLLTDTVQRLFSTQGYLHNLNFEDQDIYEIVEYLDYNTLRIETQIASLIAEDSITPEVHDYLMKQNEPIIQTKEQMELVIDSESWDVFDPSKIIPPPVIDKNEVSDLFSDSYDQKRKRAMEEHKKNTSAHYDEMEKVGSFYLDNHLGYDPLSTMLGRINTKYPLNKEFENSGSPSIVPLDGVNPDLISSIK